MPDIFRCLPYYCASRNPLYSETKSAMPHSLVRLSNDDEVRSRVVPVAPFVHDSGQLPFSGLSHADFEILLADLYREKLGSSESRWNWYDEVIRINNGADNGVDVLLTLSNQTAGVVQCKHYTSTNVGIDTVRKELLALVLRSFIIPELVSPQAFAFSLHSSCIR